MEQNVNKEAVVSNNLFEIKEIKMGNINDSDYNKTVVTNEKSNSEDAMSDNSHAVTDNNNSTETTENIINRNYREVLSPKTSPLKINEHAATNFNGNTSINQLMCSQNDEDKTDISSIKSISTEHCTKFSECFKKGYNVLSHFLNQKCNDPSDENLQEIILDDFLEQKIEKPLKRFKSLNDVPNEVMLDDNEFVCNEFSNCQSNLHTDQIKNPEQLNFSRRINPFEKLSPSSSSYTSAVEEQSPILNSATGDSSEYMQFIPVNFSNEHSEYYPPNVSFNYVENQLMNVQPTSTSTTDYDCQYIQQVITVNSSADHVEDVPPVDLVKTNELTEGSHSNYAQSMTSMNNNEHSDYMLSIDNTTENNSEFLPSSTSMNVLKDYEKLHPSFVPNDSIHFINSNTSSNYYTSTETKSISDETTQVKADNTLECKTKEQNLPVYATDFESIAFRNALHNGANLNINSLISKCRSENTSPYSIQPDSIVESETLLDTINSNPKFNTNIESNIKTSSSESAAINLPDSLTLSHDLNYIKDFYESDMQSLNELDLDENNHFECRNLISIKNVCSNSEERLEAEGSSNVIQNKKQKTGTFTSKKCNKNISHFSKYNEGNILFTGSNFEISDNKGNDFNTDLDISKINSNVETPIKEKCYKNEDSEFLQINEEPTGNLWNMSESNGSELNLSASNYECNFSKVLSFPNNIICNISNIKMQSQIHNEKHDSQEQMEILQNSDNIINNEIYDEKSVYVSMSNKGQEIELNNTESMTSFQNLQAENSASDHIELQPIEVEHVFQPEDNEKSIIFSDIPLITKKRDCNSIQESNLFHQNELSNCMYHHDAKTFCNDVPNSRYEYPKDELSNVDNLFSNTMNHPQTEKTSSPMSPLEVINKESSFDLSLPDECSKISDVELLSQNESRDLQFLKFENSIRYENNCETEYEPVISTIFHHEEKLDNHSISTYENSNNIFDPKPSTSKSSIYNESDNIDLNPSESALTSCTKYNVDISQASLSETQMDYKSNSFVSSTKNTTKQSFSSKIYDIKNDMNSQSVTSEMPSEDYYGMFTNAPSSFDLLNNKDINNSQLLASEISADNVFPTSEMPINHKNNLKSISNIPTPYICDTYDYKPSVSELNKDNSQFSIFKLPTYHMDKNNDFQNSMPDIPTYHENNILESKSPIMKASIHDENGNNSQFVTFGLSESHESYINSENNPQTETYMDCGDNVNISESRLTYENDLHQTSSEVIISHESNDLPSPKLETINELDINNPPFTTLETITSSENSKDMQLSNLETYRHQRSTTLDDRILSSETFASETTFPADIQPPILETSTNSEDLRRRKRKRVITEPIKVYMTRSKQRRL